MFGKEEKMVNHRSKPCRIPRRNLKAGTVTSSNGGEEGRRKLHGAERAASSRRKKDKGKVVTRRRHGDRGKKGIRTVALRGNGENWERQKIKVTGVSRKILGLQNTENIATARGGGDLQKEIRGELFTSLERLKI